MLNIFIIYLYGGFFVIFFPIILNFFIPWMYQLNKYSAKKGEKTRKILSLWLWILFIYLLVPIMYIFIEVFVEGILEEYLNSTAIEVVVWTVMILILVFMLFAVVLGLNPVRKITKKNISESLEGIIKKL